MTNSKKYLNPPLVEAVFELFYRSDEWSPVIPGLFYNEVKNEFPVINNNFGGFGIQFDPSGLMLGGANSELIQYRSAQNDKILQLSRNFLTVNKLPVYENWDSYKIMIKSTLGAFKKTINKFEINRIGLRFINKIDIGESHSLKNFKKYFDVYPIIPQNINKELSSIQLSFETHLIKDTEILAVSLSTMKPELKYVSPVLFQLYLTRIKDLSGINVEDWIDNAHTVLKETFENSIKKQAKTEFDNAE